jgi:hypothetical protein
LLTLLAGIIGISESRLDGPPTQEDIEEAFQWLLSQPAPAEWVTWWVGRPDVTLRHLYRDLLVSEHFRMRRQRIATG